MLCEVTVVILTQVCAKYQDPAASDSYLLVTWAAADSRQIQHMGSQRPLVSSFLLDQGREDMILTGENWTHASSFVTGVRGCEMFPSPLRDLLNPFDVDRGSCEWGGEWVGSGKWESFQVLISSEVPCLFRCHQQEHILSVSKARKLLLMTRQTWPPGPVFSMPWTLPPWSWDCVDLGPGFYP